jgi:hypothetical protein
MKNVMFSILFSFVFITSVYAVDSTTRDEYQRQMLTYTVTKDVDYRYPLPVNKFIFRHGESELGFYEMLELTKDPVLLKRQDYMKKTRIAGFTTAGVLGAATISFLVPSIVFAAQANNPLTPLADEYLPTGFAMIYLTVASSLLLLVDLVVTFSLLLAFRSRERFIREAVDRYNHNLRKKLGILPDVGFLGNNSLSISYGYNL